MVSMLADGATHVGVATDHVIESFRNRLWPDYKTGDGVERALLVGSLLFILVVELLNSAVEAVVDRVSIEDHALSRRAKDLGSAAAMVSIPTGPPL